MVQNGNHESRWLDPSALMKLKSLELQIKVVVEGFLLGLHRSPYHGFSAEFTEYRPYVAGEDTRYLDWKLYARSDRNYIKKFREETNVRTYLLLDQSRSMAFSSGEYNKLDYARVLLGSVGYFFLRQRDAVGACRFDDTVHDFLPPRVRTGHLRHFLRVLHGAEPGHSTDLGGSVAKIGRLIANRSLVILASDFLGNLDSLEKEIGILRARGNDLIMVQVLDPAEIEWRGDRNLLVRDMETGREIFVQGGQAAERYRRRFADHQAKLSRICNTGGVRLCHVSTSQPVDQFAYHLIKSAAPGWLAGEPAGLARATAGSVVESSSGGDK